MRQKWRSEENVIFRGEERSDENLSKKIEKDETASPSAPRLSIDAKTITFEMEEMKRKKKSSVRELQGLLRSCSFLNTLKTSLKIFYQEKLLQEKLVINFCILLTRRFNSKTSKMSICVWKYLRKTITSMTENNLHQVHRRLEENCSSFNSSIRKSFAASEHLAHELLIRLRFFWATRDLENSPKIDTSKKKEKHLFPLIIEDNLLGRHLEKFVQHFDT